MALNQLLKLKAETEPPARTGGSVLCATSSSLPHTFHARCVIPAYLRTRVLGSPGRLCKICNLHSTQRPLAFSQFRQETESLLGHPSVPGLDWECPCFHTSLLRQQLEARYCFKSPV